MLPLYSRRLKLNILVQYRRNSNSSLFLLGFNLVNSYGDFNLVNTCGDLCYIIENKI